MKLKRILALVLCFAMVLSTMSFSVFAEDSNLYVSSDYNSETEGFGVTKFSNYAGAYAYAIANNTSATIVIEKTNSLSGNTFDNEHKNYTKLAVVIKDGATMGNALSKWDMTYPVTVEAGGTLTCARPQSASVSNVHIKNKLIIGTEGSDKQAYCYFLSDSYQDCDISIRCNGSVELYNAVMEVQDLDAQGKFTATDSDIKVDGAFSSATYFYATTLTDSTMEINGEQITGGLSDFAGGDSNQLGVVTLNGNSSIKFGEGSTVKVAGTVNVNGSSSIEADTLTVNKSKKLNVNGAATVNAQTLTNNGTVAAATDATVTAVTISEDSTGEATIDGKEAEFNENGMLVLSVDDTTYSAMIGTQGYETLQAAINEVKNGETIEFVGDITEELVTIEKTSDVAFTIDGKDNKFTGEFEIGIGENITIQNINFVATDEISPEYFIDSMDKNSNCVLSIQNCTFADTDYSTTAIGTHQPTKVVINECEASGVASLMQNQGGYDITVTNTTIEGKRGISLGSVIGAKVENVTINAADDKYGIRLNGENDNNTITIKDCTVSAFIPVVVRKAQVENYNLIFDGTNTMTAANTDDYWCVIGSSEYETNGSLPTAPTGKVKVTLSDAGLDKEGIYGAYKPVAQIGDSYFESLSAAITAAQPNDTITLLSAVTEDVTIGKSITIDGANCNYTGMMKIDANVKVNIKNVNFVNGTGYAVRTGGGCSVNIEDCTAKNYSYGFIYAPKSTNVITVKSVTIDNCNRGLRADSLNKAIFEDVKMTNMTIGIDTKRNAKKTYTFKNCEISATNVIEYHGTEEVAQEFIFEGTNTLNTIDEENIANAILKLYDEDSVLITACDGLTVTSDDAKHNVLYEDGAYKVAKAARIGEKYYITLADAIAAADDGDTITLIWNEGREAIAMNGAVFGKSITITGDATVDWSKGFLFVGRGGEGNGTVIFDNANLKSASNSASYGIHVSGREKDTTNKYDGTLIIKNSTIELDYLINRGAIELDNGTLTVKNGFGIAGRPASETESGTDATATITLNNNSKVIVNNHNGMGLGQASTTPEGYGIMNVNSDSTFQSTQNFLITEKGTMNINGGNVIIGGNARANNGNVTLTNNGIIKVSGTSDIVSNVNGTGWVYINGATLGADTKLTGAKVRFASGTNNVNGSVIDNGCFQVGIGAYAGVDANVDTTNGVIVNVKNAKIGSNGNTYAGWVGTGFYDTDAEKAAAMTNAKYVLNIENSIAEFGYLHVSNDGELNVKGNATEKAHYNNSDYSFYAGDFIINGTATFDATDVLAIDTKISCDNGTTTPGTLNIVNGTTYEAERHNGAIAGNTFRLFKTGVANVDKTSELYIGEPSSIAADAVMNISGEVTARGAITNNGTINLTKDALLNADDSVQVFGTLKSVGNVRGTITKAADSAVFDITGGTYTQDDISKYVADGYKVVYQESTKLYYVFPDFTVEAIATPETAVAGDTITVKVMVTEGGKYTNASWVLKYDPTYVTYDGTDAKNYKISGKEHDGNTDNGIDEFDENTTLGTYTFTVNNDVTAGTALFEIVSAEVHNYEMAAEFDGISASTKPDSVKIGLKTGIGSIGDKEVPYNGAQQRGNEVTGAPAGARITYSTSETNFSNGTQLPPAFDKVGEHTYYAKIEVDGYGSKIVEGKLTITPISVTPSVEWSVAPESDRVGYTPVIIGVLDETYKTGKVTVINGVDADGKENVIAELEAKDFVYNGHGKAVYSKELEISGVASGELMLTVKYTAGTDDNYLTSEGTKTVNVDKSTINETTEGNLEAAIVGASDKIIYDGITHYVTVDESVLPAGWTATVANHNGVTYFGDVNVVDVTFTDTTGKYNDYTATVMIKIVRREVTIYVNNVTKKNGQADSEVLPGSYTVSPAIIGNDLGDIKIVRAEGQTGEVDGPYTITATYTPNNNYIVHVEDGTLTITDAVYEIEVVDNSKNLNAGIDAEADYTVGTRMILVHTDADYAYFTYNGEKMYDVSDAGYEYFEHDYTNNNHKPGKKYQHVYAIVVEAEYGYEATEANEKLYADGVSCVGKDASYAPIKVTYDVDINDKDALHVNDYSMVKGIYNSIYKCKDYQISILKADYNKNKIVNTTDAYDVKQVVIK